MNNREMDNFYEEDFEEYELVTGIPLGRPVYQKLTKEEYDRIERVTQYLMQPSQLREYNKKLN